MSYKVAVVGATGNVGREMLSVLDERAFPASEVVALAISPVSTVFPGSQLKLNDPLGATVALAGGSTAATVRAAATPASASA